MPWVKRFAAGVVAALRSAQREDPQIAQGFERRVAELIERERTTLLHQSWDQPSERTVRLVRPVVLPAVTRVTVLPRREPAADAPRQHAAVGGGS